MTDVVLVQVAESAKVLLDADQEVPCDLMAKVVKSLLLHIKRLDQQRREAEEAEQASVSARTINQTVVPV